MMVLLLSGTVLLWIPVLAGTVDSMWQTALATVGLWSLGAIFLALKKKK